MFLRGLQASAHVIVGGNTRIGYVHVWSYAGQRYQSALEDLIADGPLRDADALVWDLAVDDVLVDGERLEGVGVTPTVEVAFDSRYAGGKDPQLEHAVQILSRS